MLFTTTDGAELFYEVLGPGSDDRERVVLLNGIMMTTRTWAPQLRALTARFRCVLHDFRGQLRSPHRAPLNIEQHADDLAALLDHLDIERAHVVGTSYGGEVGMIFAYTYPERVKSLTVIASTSRADEHMRQRVFAAMNAATTEHDRLYDIVARDFFSPGFLGAHPEILSEGRARMAAYPDDFFAGYVNLCDAFSALDITDNLRAIRCPTLVIAAERDTLKPVPCSETIANEIEGARLLVIPNAGHAVVIERPDDINLALLEFLG
jgi:3-oxoadipate enol-lactonase